jgi:glycosyltransferase involved in cell wall biosynthesis
MISTLLPTYKGEEYIDATVKSVLAQTYENFELLVGINGDSQEEVQEKLSKFSDPRVKIFNYTHAGKPRTLNKLLDEASYEIIALLDDDDVWHNKKLELQIELTKEYDVVGSQITYIDEFGLSPSRLGYGPMLHTDPVLLHKLMLMYQNNLANSAVLIKKQSIIDAGKWNESIPALEDMDLWLRMLKNGCKFINVNHTLMYHRIHETSKYNAVDRNIKKWDPKELLGYINE